MRTLSQILCGTLATVTFAIGPVQAALSGPTGNEWQLKRLFAPTQRQLTQEAKGKVFIYYGLRDVDIERAMREEFNRVQNMMFAGTIITNEGEPKKDVASGDWLREDDGCD